MRACLALILMLPLAAGAQLFGSDERASERQRQTGPEAQVTLPQFPRQEDYLPFEVSATTPFDFFVDAKSLSVGADWVVRYTVIAKSSGGALNISFEGMRCADNQFRVYALGRADKTWAEVRNSKWETIRGEARNAQRTVLFNDYFCPMAGNIATAEDGVRALKNGGNPRAGIKGY
jgi:hypothetical protein